MRHIALGIVILLILLPFIHAATTATTAFIFKVSTSRSLTVTYGGNCSATAFFYNEIDANFDPDSDGNAAKVKPNSLRGEYTQIITDFNYVGVSNPSDKNVAYEGNPTGTPPATNTNPSSEISTANYTNIGTDDTSYQSTSTTSAGRIPSIRFVFRTNIAPQRIIDLNITYLGDALTDATNCDLGAGTDKDLNMYIWNYALGSYRALDSEAGLEAGQASVSPKVLNSTIQSDFNQIISSDGNIVVIAQGVSSDGAVESCLFSDFVNLRITYIPVATTFCQSSTLSPLTLTNAGNVDVNVDGNFSSAFTGADGNIVLKVWMGTGTGCGTDGNGLGGWQKDCTVTGVTSPVTATTCKNYNSGNATTGSRLVTKLLVGDSNQLCFSGDFNAFVSAGDHNKDFQAGSDFS